MVLFWFQTIKCTNKYLCIFREKSRAFKVGRSKDTINLCYARNALFLNWCAVVACIEFIIVDSDLVTNSFLYDYYEIKFSEQLFYQKIYMRWIGTSFSKIRYYISCFCSMILFWEGTLSEPDKTSQNTIYKPQNQYQILVDDDPTRSCLLTLGLDNGQK